MRLFAVLVLTIALHAEDVPKPTVEQLQAQLAEQSVELRIYQQGLFQCQAAEIHAQAQAQAKQQRPKTEQLQGLAAKEPKAPADAAENKK